MMKRRDYEHLLDIREPEWSWRREIKNAQRKPVSFFGIAFVMTLAFMMIFWLLGS